jgi:hypothetical protein
MPGRIKKIVVAGDVTIDWLQWRVKAKDPVGDGEAPRLNWELYQGTRMTPKAGGALLLARLVEAAVAGNNRVLTHRLENLEDIPTSEVLHSIILLKEFPYTPDKQDVKNRTYRVDLNLGYAGPENAEVKPLKVEGDTAEADLVVLDDAGNGYRDNPKGNEVNDVWPLAIRTPGKEPLVILKMSRPLQTGKLWAKLHLAHAARLVVVINADDLRSEGVDISRRLSWERTAMDFVWHIINNSALRPLAQCRHLVVRFGLDGVVYYRGGKDPRARLYYDPLRVEGGFQEEVGHGGMTGLTMAFVAALAAEISAQGLKGVAEGVFQGILSSRRMLLLGFGKDAGQLNYPGQEIFQPQNIFFPEKEGEARDPEPFICNIEIPHVGPPECTEPSYWTILGSTAKDKLEEVAGKVVRQGTDPVLAPVPVGRFGKLKTMDRTEIESLQSIKNLLHEYMKKGHQERPLSVAVFGQPGSGKSFTVTQVAQSVAGEDIQRLEFNLSQWQSAQDLIKALHQVRDVALKGKVPLVFFDEFDSKCGQEPLGWLKYFLGPMQDGEFKEGEITHPIGKAIFAFAGGTSQTLQEFCREELAEKDLGQDEMAKKLKELKEAFKGAKGPDFVSRLKGYVNIPGLTPGKEKDDRLYLVRRALLLRSLLERKGKDLLDSHGNLQIDGGVLEAFLKVYYYKHGARSLEAVLDMSMLSGSKTFEAAALPPAEQLRLHVDAQQFCRLLVQEAVFDSMVERLAQKIHEKFVQDQAGKKPATDANMQPWEKLREDIREENRKQARDTKAKLKAVNCGIIPVGERASKLFEFTPEEIEIMAIMEHERWMKSKKDDNWTYAPPPRDDEKKTHHCQLPWEELSEDEKQKDRDTIKALPDMLHEIGFEVYSLVPEENRQTKDQQDNNDKL